MPDWRTRLGIFRSELMYYWKPFNRRRLKAFYAQFIQAGDLCFDIGAHLGNRSDAWLNLQANVVAVDPQPSCIAYLERRFQNSPIHIVPKAVGSEVGKATLHVSKATPTVSTMSDNAWRETINDNAWYDVKWENQIEVELTTLDQLIAQFGRPVFCKIDVENYEAEVLRGLNSPIDVISFEYFPPAIDRTLDCFPILNQLGVYEYNWSFGESLQLASDQWLDPNQMQDVLNKFSLHREYGDVYARRVQ